MTAWDALVDDLRTEQLDRSYLGQPAPATDPLGELIGVLAGLLGEEQAVKRRQQRTGRKVA